MANKTPNTIGGKVLASEIYDFMKSNVDDMKSNGANRDAEKNEEQGNRDLANAIAFAIENVFKSQIIIPGPATPTPLITGTGPVTGAIDLSMANPKYVFK